MSRGAAAWSAFVVLAGLALVLHEEPPAPPRREVVILAEVDRQGVTFSGPGGTFDRDLRVPEGRDVRLVVRSRAPRTRRFLSAAGGFRVVIAPGERREVRFRPPPVGVYPIEGADGARLAVVVREELAWVGCNVGRPPTLDLRAWGEELYASNGCPACHGEAAFGPPLGGVFLTERPLADGRRVLATPAYLRRAIVDPGADVARGSESRAMPAYSLSPGALDALVAYLAWTRPPEDCPSCDPAWWPSSTDAPPEPPSAKHDLLAAEPLKRASGKPAPQSED